MPVLALPGERRILKGALLLLLGAAPIALTGDYGQWLHEASVADTRLFLGTIATAVLVLVGASRRTEAAPGALDRAVLLALGSVVALAVANGLSFFGRSGDSFQAWGFPFLVHESVYASGESTSRAGWWGNIFTAALCCLITGSSQLPIIARASGLRRLLCVAACSITLYAGLFSFWWLTSKRESGMFHGKEIREVELHQNDLMSLTQPMWNPAFWFVERILGYDPPGYIAAMEDSAFVFTKTRTPAGKK